MTFDDTESQKSPSFSNMLGVRGRSLTYCDKAQRIRFPLVLWRELSYWKRLLGAIRTPVRTQNADLCGYQARLGVAGELPKALQT